MAKNTNSHTVVADMGCPNSEPQWDYFTADEKYICYGGARGGGKTWCTTRKAPMMAYEYPGIRILVIRRQFADMEDTIIQPILSCLAPGTFKYNKSDHKCTISNGSFIRFGNLPDYNATTQGRYQGQEYDIVFLEEATQFLESEFRGIAATVRGTNGFPKRIYMTCNPGGVGHFWVKRLFIDRQFKDNEIPSEYRFIKATVFDNADLMLNDKTYVDQLKALPEDIRAAHLFGDWNALSGVYFGEFQDGVHTCKPFPIPAHWRRYRAMDYGLDMHFAIWVAVDEKGRAYVYKTFSKSDQPVSDAAASQLSMTRSDEHITYTIAPPDLWKRNQESGKSQAITFAECGVPLFKASNNRIQGWMALKELFKVQKDGFPMLRIFDTETSLIECVKCLQHDQTIPNDVSKNPHGITHGPDALRYYAITYTLPAKKQEPETEYFDDEEENEVSYKKAVCGGKPTRSYIFS